MSWKPFTFTPSQAVVSPKRKSAMVNFYRIVDSGPWRRTQGMKYRLDHKHMVGRYAGNYRVLSTPSGQGITSDYCDYDEDDYDNEWACTHCCGDGYQESDDPLWDGADEIPCRACNGTGERKHQVIF